MDKYNIKGETIEHLLTVLSIMLKNSDDYSDKVSYHKSQELWNEALEYLKSYIDELNICGISLKQ